MHAGSIQNLSSKIRNSVLVTQIMYAIKQDLYPQVASTMELSLGAQELWYFVCGDQYHSTQQSRQEGNHMATHGILAIMSCDARQAGKGRLVRAADCIGEAAVHVVLHGSQFWEGMCHTQVTC